MAAKTIILTVLYIIIIMVDVNYKNKFNLKLFFIFFIALNLNLCAQNENVIFVEYQNSTYDTLNSNKKAINKIKLPEDETIDIMKNMRYGLYIKNNKSVFNLIESIEKDENIERFRLKQILSGGSFFYDNFNKTSINTVEFGGQKFNIILPKDKYNWVIGKEQKKINGYLCYNATCHFERFDKFRKKSLTFDPVVWFTPELPFPFGPKGMNNLPGLILEGSLNGKLFFYATKINLNFQNIKFDIEKPTTGIMVSEDEYSDIQIKLINEKMIKNQ
jgi:GLPGLI family protein